MIRLYIIFLSAFIVLLGSTLWFFHSTPLAIHSTISVQNALTDDESSLQGFTRAFAPKPIIFPRDHGLHDNFKTEWWYFTGNLHTSDGRRFGYQLTFFRQALTPPLQKSTQGSSSWASSNIVMAHCTLTDVQNHQFYSSERFSRLSHNLAGCTLLETDTSAGIRLWLEDWEAISTMKSERNFVPRTQITPSAFPLGLKAGISKEIKFHLALDSIKPTTLQGEKGWSRKGITPGNASYYYSLTRLATKGTICIGNETFAVEGTSWMDREWSSSALEKNQIGWDWFALQLDDGRDIMYYQLRKRAFRDQSMPDSTSTGIIVEQDGRTRRIFFADVIIKPLSFWVSPTTKATYPSTWSLSIPREHIVLTIQPLMQNQELQTTVQYWEGAVQIFGSQSSIPLSGYGYVEMTGYADKIQSIQ